ncbi:SDR family NAD(P)-dependent oxidoreductase [Oceanibaculum indicum]|uniref:NAD(P)-dependent dehydrogenase (Short-subunit alcohol dehydrogenase family) n=1 Tax=Oceanibaculum indicum TaxID=526216 RepID=A0A420WQY0_9PROT|nr:SDR family oxidoreductase [Oceanibaculum indicum]RKQ73448.1 NAD(P)-dependent dehydrogenase (short-subunit alcohol dehydrogenase family) [Oceanibaculum indicum]
MSGDIQRVYLVTGAGSGIGAAVCRRLAGSGIGLLVHTGSKREKAVAVAEECTAKGAACQVAVGDLAEAETAGMLVSDCQKHFGRLDGVIANAGFADRRTLQELDEEGLDRSIDVILRGSFRLAKAAQPLLAQSPSGRIVTVSSFVAHVFRLDGDAFTASAAAKGGLEALTRSLAAQMAPQGITVNAVVPGYVQKDAVSGRSAMDDGRWKQAVARIPLGRLGRPDDIAAMIALLAGPEGSYITGQAIHVDGGLTL